MADINFLRGSAEPTRRCRKLSIRDQLLVHYQPIVDLRSGEVLGVEALARIADNDRIIFPGEFLPKLSSGARRGMLFAVLAQGLAVLARYNTIRPDLTLSINVDSSVMLHEDFASRITQTIGIYGVDPQRIELEILEGGEFLCLDTARRQVQELKAQGLSVALDDIGSAYSSLMRLKALPVDAIKLDQAFVRGLTEAPDDLRFVSAVTCLARGLGKRLVVEGVETPEILDAMRVMGVEAAQGYAIARPMSAEKLSEWLAEYVPVPASRKPASLLGAYASHLSVLEACRALLNQPLKSTWLDDATDPHECDIGRYFEENHLHDTPFGIAHKEFHAALPYYESDRGWFNRATAQMQQTLSEAIRNGVSRLS